MKDDKIRALQDRLGCAFQDLGRLRQALTHSSTGASGNYERLEFLGDRVIGIVMAEILYDTFPEENEGALAKRHAALVQGETLAAIAREVDLGGAMELSGAERAAGGARNDNILADGLEAVIGALYIDAGLGACQAMMKRVWGDRVLVMKDPPSDPKTTLQEWAQARGLPLPAYDLAGRAGPDHAPLFDIRVTVQGFPPAQATGPSRRVAEKEAARLLLETLS